MSPRRRILLASDDAPFVDKLSAAAAERGVELHTVGAEQGGDVARPEPAQTCMYVLHADGVPRRGALSTTAFAARHPGIPVVLLAARADARAEGGSSCSTSGGRRSGCSARSRPSTRPHVQ